MCTFRSHPVVRSLSDSRQPDPTRSPDAASRPTSSRPARTASRLGLLGVLFAAGCLVAVSTGCAGTGHAVSLFDGKTLTGWKVFHISGPEAVKPDAYSIEDGVIACKGYGGHWLCTNDVYEDFDLHVEFKIAKGSNSGVCPRSPDHGDPPYATFEVQIVDDAGQDPGKHTTGAIYDIVTPMYNASKPIGEWNEMDIRCVGPHCIVNLNGLKVIDTDFSKLTTARGKFNFPYSQLPAKGHICFQDHNTPVWFRNIRIERL